MLSVSERLESRGNRSYPGGTASSIGAAKERTEVCPRNERSLATTGSFGRGTVGNVPGSRKNWPVPATGEAELTCGGRRWKLRGRRGWFRLFGRRRTAHACHDQEPCRGRRYQNAFYLSVHGASSHGFFTNITNGRLDNHLHPRAVSPLARQRDPAGATA